MKEDQDLRYLIILSLMEVLNVDFQSLVERKLEPVGSMGNDIIYRCPKCEGVDGSGHLYVNYDKGYYHCFKCALSGRRIESLLRVLGMDIDYDYEKIYSDRDKDLDLIINPKKEDKTIVDYSTDLNVLSTYYRNHIAPLSLAAYEYLKRRGVPDHIISSLGICEGINRYGESWRINGKEFVGRDYSGRIMIPSLRKDGSISFYVARDYIGDKESKYLNPPKCLVAASEDVWSLDIIETSSVIICEGVFTAIAVNSALGKNIACATYGKSIAQRSSNGNATSQGEKLLSKKFESYILFYDKDAYTATQETAMYLYDRGANVRIVTIPEDMYGPKADAGDMKPEEIIRLIRDSEEFNRFSGIL